VAHGIVFAPEQRVDAGSGRCGKFTKAAAMQFVRDEYLALRWRQFLDRSDQLIGQDAAQVVGFGARGFRGQQRIEYGRRFIG